MTTPPPSDPFEKSLRSAAHSAQPRADFTADLRARLAEQQAQRNTRGARFGWARPLVAQGLVLAALVGLVALAMVLTPHLLPGPQLRPGQQIEVTATPLPNQPDPTVPTGPDGLPTDALARLGLGQILAMDTAVDGRLAVGSTLGICVYNTGHTADWCRPFGLAHNISWLLFNPSGDRLAVALSENSGAGKIVVLDAFSGEALAAHPFSTSLPGWSLIDSAMAWDPSGLPRLAIPGEPGTLLVWDWQSDTTVWGPLDLREAVGGEQWFAADWAQNAQGQSLLAVGGRSGLVLLDGATGEALLRLDPTWQPAPISNISSVDFSADGLWLAYNYTDGAVALRIEDGQVVASRMWETNHWQPMQVALGPQGMGYPLAMQVKEGMQVAPVEGDASPANFSSSFGPLAWTAQGTLYFTRADGMLGIYQDGQENIILGEYSVWPQHVAWSSMDEVLSLTGSAITRWDTRSGRLGAVSNISLENPVLLAVSDDDARAAYSQEGAAAIVIWDTASNQALVRLENASRTRLATFSGDGSRLVSIGPNGQLVLWDAASGQKLREMDAAPLDSQQDALAITPDGRAAALAGVREGGLYLDLWDLEDGAKTRELPIDTNVTAMAFSPDGRTLAAATSGSVTLWDTASGDKLQMMGPEYTPMATDAIYSGDSTRFYAIAWSPDGQTLATGGSQVTVWSAAQGLPLRAYGGHRGVVNSLAYRADGLVLASGSVDGTILLWDLGAGGLPPVVQQPTATPLPTGTPLPAATEEPIFPTVTAEPTFTPQPVESGPSPEYPTVTPTSFIAEQGMANDALWRYVSALAAGKDNPNEYQQAANLYGGSWEALIQQNPDVPANNLPALLQRACEVNIYNCAPPQQIQTAGEQDGFLFDVQYVDGSKGRFRVQRQPDGMFLVMNLPPRKT